MRLFHLHIWVYNCQVARFAVRTCKCGRQETLLFDQQQQRSVWIRGVYHPLHPFLGVLAADAESFLRWRRHIEEELKGIEIQYLDARHVGDTFYRYDGFYFLEGWHTNPDYEGEAFVNLLNRILDKS